FRFNKGSQQDVEFTAGRRGRGLLLKEGVSLDYVGQELFENSEGTLAFWVRPVGWQGEDGKYHWFANLYSPTSSHLFYKYGAGGQVIVYVTGSGRTPNTIGQNHTWDAFREGRWTHLALTFKPGEQVFYIDGKPMQKRVDSRLIEPRLEGKVATVNLHEGHPANAIDELMTFRRALTELEVRALYGTMSERPVLTAPPIQSPTVDSREEDDPWASATTFTGWVDRVLGIAAAHNTRVSVGHNRQRLFVRFRRPIPEVFRQQRDLFVGSPLKIVAEARDDSLEADDHVTVLLRSPRGDTYSLAVNGRNVRHDARNGDATWNGNWEVRQELDDQQWVVDYAIPLHALDPTADAPPAREGIESRWGINFLDASRQIEPADMAWYRDAAMPSWGRLELGNANERLELSGLGDLGGGEIAVRGHVGTTLAATLASGYAVSAGSARRPLRTSSSLESAQSTDELSSVYRGELLQEPGGPASMRADWSSPDPLFGELVLRIGREERPLYRWQAPFVYSPQQRVAAHYLPSYRRLRVVIDAGSAGTLTRLDHIVVTITQSHEKGARREDETGAERGEGNPALRKALKKPQRVLSVVEFDCQELALGNYDVTAEFVSAESACSAQAAFEILPDPPWLGNDLGKSPLVPRPWTPVRCDGSVVRVLGRQYDFGKMGLPTQVTIAEHAQLNEAARMLIGLAGAPPQEVQGAVALQILDDSRVSFAANATVRGVVIRTTGFVTFDGLVETTIQLTSKDSVTLDSLTIEFPFKRQAAELWCPQEYVARQAGRAPAEKHVSQPSSQLRIGDAERGIQFSQNAVQRQLLPDGDTYRLRYEFVEKPLQLGPKPIAPFRLTWQGLPVKPRSPLYRRIHIDDALWTTEVEKQPFHITPVYTEGWNRHWNYHNFWNREVFEEGFVEKIKKKIHDDWRRDRKTFSMYMNIATFDANTPEYRRYRFEWVGDQAEYFAPDPSRRDEVKQVMINSEEPSFLDFYMWHINKTIRYLTDEGQIPIHCYLDNTVANREYMLRLWRLVKGINSQNQIIVHMSGDNAMHAYGFADWLVEGEENTASYLNRRAADPSLPKNYTRILNLDMVRARYSPFAFGDKFLLYQFWVWRNDSPAREHLWGLLAVHDGTTWAASGPGRFKKDLAEFGWDDRIRFVPYWRSGTGIKVASDVQPVVASGWTRGPQKLLLLVVNDSARQARVALTVDGKRFGYASEQLVARFHPQGGLRADRPGTSRARSFHSGKPLQFNLPEHSWQLVRVSEPNSTK
ncbi:MAG: glycoside hydrolase domain-containing protein, partial [Planctomycetota bacterium]|nr:glycoside hydrolase domain-containing protein [Planctomycetota bacterium]